MKYRTITPLYLARFWAISNRFISKGRVCWLAIMVLAAWDAGAAATNSLLRVTTWNLAPKLAAGADGFSQTYQRKLISKAAESLKELNPDVILLQQVTSQENCERLVQALRPEIYHVAVCSSFWDIKAGSLSSHQVAILSKVPPYRAWMEPWQNNGSPGAPGGFAFAAIRIGFQNIGFFSTQFGDAMLAVTNLPAAAQEREREELSRQLIQQITSPRNLSSNSLQSLIVGGDFNANADEYRFFHRTVFPELKQFGLQNAFEGLDLENGTNQHAPGAACILVRNAGHVSNPQVSRAMLSRFRAATCDLDLEVPVAVPPPASLAQSKAPVAAMPSNAQPALSTTLNNDQVKILAAIGVAAILIFGFILLRRSQPRASKNQSMVIVQADTGKVAGSLPKSAQIPHDVRQSLISQMNRWLKEKVIRRLATDRAQLLVVQDTATAKMLAVDERLANVERQIQRRNEEYEQRLAVLQKELLQAKEENRELIQLQITMLQAEMAKQKAQDKSSHRLN